MAKRKRVQEASDADLILEATHESTLLDMLDKLLNKGLQRKAKARVVRNRPRSQHP